MSLMTASTPVGATFSGQPRHVTWERTWAYAGGPFAQQGWPAQNIHTDAQYARSVGLAEPNVAGTQAQGYIVQLLVDLFGEQWLSHGKLYDLKFIRAIPIGAIIQVHAQVLSRESEGAAIRYTLAVRCLVQSGEETIIARAVGWL
ncbi:MAG: MaoC family dehydratase [Ktedonobacteraceae bacterium]|nr:MaoC family dehydratase [Ktedonobacteraceae bacterium]